MSLEARDFAAREEGLFRLWVFFWVTELLLFLTQDLETHSVRNRHRRPTQKRERYIGHFCGLWVCLVCVVWSKRRCLLTPCPPPAPPCRIHHARSSPHSALPHPPIHRAPQSECPSSGHFQRPRARQQPTTQAQTQEEEQACLPWPRPVVWSPSPWLRRAMSLRQSPSKWRSSKKGVKVKKTVPIAPPLLLLRGSGASGFICCWWGAGCWPCSRWWGH